MGNYEKKKKKTNLLTSRHNQKQKFPVIHIVKFSSNEHCEHAQPHVAYHFTRDWINAIH